MSDTECEHGLIKCFQCDGYSDDESESESDSDDESNIDNCEECGNPFETCGSLTVRLLVVDQFLCKECCIKVVSKK